MLRYLNVIILLTISFILRTHADDQLAVSKYIKECQHVEVEDVLLNPDKYNEKIICGIALLSDQRIGFGLQKLGSTNIHKRTGDTLNLEIQSAEEVNMIKTFTVGGKVFFLGKLHFYNQCWDTMFYKCQPDEKLFELDLDIIFSLEGQ